MFKRDFFLRILFILNLIAVVGLGISYLSLFFSPEHFWMFAFMGLAYPIFLISNIIFVCIWIFFRWKKALLSGIIILIGISKINDLYQWRSIADELPRENIQIEDSTFKVLSYNVRLFDLYNWTENKRTRNQIMELIHNEQADILCLQEFFYEDTGNFNTLDTLRQIQQAKYVHIEHSAHVKNVNHWGIATFTRFPIVGKGIILFRDSTDNISMFTDVKLLEDTVRIYNLHLESIRFRSEDYKVLQSITGVEDNTNLDGPQKIISRMRRAYIRRARQTDIIRKHIEESPFPAIVCGDFNDTPNSYAYHQISQGLDDAFRTSGSGLGTTYIGKIPFLRIDYILYHPEAFESLFFKTIRQEHSDHYPVMSKLKLLSKRNS